MPTNIEIKARARDFDRRQKLAESLTTTRGEVLNQIDTFFNVPTGRLKLRELTPDHGQLIQYLREDGPGPKQSSYLITVTQEPATLRSVLGAALGVRGENRKCRTVYHVGQTRIHFDRVERLGAFIELEVVLQAAQSLDEGAAVAKLLMKQLEIEERDLADGAYLDMLQDVPDPQS